MVTLELASPPAVEPVSLEEAKAHLRLDDSTEDAIISELITGARHVVESFTERALVQQEWKLLLDHWPGTPMAPPGVIRMPGTSTRLFLEIPRPPLKAVESVKVYADNGIAVTWDPQFYFVDTASTPGRILRRSITRWPRPSRSFGGIEIRFQAGYGDPADVPQPLRQAILMLVAHWYENREPVPPRTVGAALPLSIEMLLSPYRLRRL